MNVLRIIKVVFILCALYYAACAIQEPWLNVWPWLIGAFFVWRTDKYLFRLTCRWLDKLSNDYERNDRRLHM